MSLKLSKKDRDLLASLAHAEAGVDGLKAGKAVVDVVLNRLASPEFPNTVRGVIGHKVNGRYQFEPVKKHGGVDHLPKAPSNWRSEIPNYTSGVLSGTTKRVAPNAFFFQNRAITKKRGTAFGQKQGVKIGQQVFSADYRGRVPAIGAGIPNAPSAPTQVPELISGLPQKNRKATTGLFYTNKSAIRNKALVNTLEANIRDTVRDVYGPGAKANVYSGGQSWPRTIGSTRHNNGKAADVHVYDADGKQIKGDRLAPLAQAWRSRDIGGVGLEMRGGGIHLDIHRDRARNWDYSKKGGRYSTAQREAIEAGNKGIAPEYYAEKGPSASGRFGLASGPSGVGRASLDMAGAMMGTPRSKGLAYAPSLSAAPREAVQALSLQDLPKMQEPSRSNISQSGNLPSAPLGNVERSSLPDLPRQDARLAMADFDRSFRMGSVSPPKAYGQARASAGVPASARASAAFPSGFKAPSISPRMAEAQSMAALDAIPSAPIDLVGDMQPAFGQPKAPDVQPVDLPQIGAKPQAVAAPNPYGTFSVPKRMMDPTAPNLIPNTKLPNAPNPVGVKGAQALSKMALTGLGGVIGGMPGALVGRLAAKALEDRVGDAAGDLFTGGVVGPSGHSYAPGSDIARGVDAMQGGDVGDFWNHTADTPAAGLAYSRERAALEGRPAPKSLFQKMGEDLGGGSSSGGGTIICSELHEQGYMPKEIWEADEEWGRMIARKDPDIIRGYRYWAAPVVRLMQRSERATKIIAWLTKPWAYQMAYEVGAVERGSFLGYCTNAIGIPLSWTVGKALKLRKKWRFKYGWA